MWPFRSAASLQLQALDNTPLLEVDLEYFVDIGCVHLGIPDAFGVHDQQRALIAAVEAAGTVDTALAFAVEMNVLDLFLQVIAHLLAAGRAAAFGAVVTLVGAEKNMVLVILVGHSGLSWSGWKAEYLSALPCALLSGFLCVLFCLFFFSVAVVVLLC